MRRIAVAQPVERQGQAVAPAAQGGVLGDEFVGTAEPGVLEHRKQQIISVSCGRPAEIGVFLKGGFKRRCDCREFAEPAGPIGAVFFKRATEGRLARVAEVLAVFRRQA